MRLAKCVKMRVFNGSTLRGVNNWLIKLNRARTHSDNVWHNSIECYAIGYYEAFEHYDSEQSRLTQHLLIEQHRHNRERENAAPVVNVA